MKLKKIDKDNCVLTENELWQIDMILKNTILQPAGEIQAAEATQILQELFLKIKALNDYRKEQEK